MTKNNTIIAKTTINVTSNTSQTVDNLLYNGVMSKLVMKRPTLIMLYGFPGSGKTYFSRQLSEEVQAAHVQGDRIRFELFENPRYDKQENEVINHLMNYMTEEFLSAGISVIYDANSMRFAQRRALRDLARRSKASHALIWLQIDADSALARVTNRDRRKTDDKYAAPIDRKTFDALTNQMQNPNTTEDYIVISGKHTFPTQRSAVMKRLYDIGLLTSENAAQKMVKPELVNRIPKPLAGRVDNSRRNIIIR
jgi:predicted kinase